MFWRHEFWFSMSMQACAIKACMSWVWISEGISSEKDLDDEGKISSIMRMKRALTKAIFG